MAPGKCVRSGRHTPRVSRRWLCAAALASAGGAVVAAACGDPAPIEHITTITALREVEKIVTRAVLVEQLIAVRITVIPTPTPPPRRTELTVNLGTDHTSGARGRATRWGLQTLEGLEPSLRVNVVPRPEGELALLLATGAAPEALLGRPYTFTHFLPSGAWTDISPLVGTLGERMHAVPADTYFVLDTYTDNQWEHSVPMLRRMEGPQYGYAFALTLSGWLYNATLFARSGVPAPSAAWTWDEALEQGKRLTSPEAGAWGIWARDDAAFGYLPLCYASGLDRAVDAGLAHTTLDTPAAVEAVAWHVRLIHQHRVSPPLGAPGPATEAAANPFTAGTIALWPSGLAALGDLTEQIGNRFA